jgi:hypothetical protein
MKLSPVFIVVGVGIVCTYALFKRSFKNKDRHDVIIDLEESPKEPPKESPKESPKENVNETEDLSSVDEDKVASDHSSVESLPYDKFGFGLDNRRNTDDRDLDDYMNLPLVGSSKTHLNEKHADVDSPKVLSQPPTKYKYLRLTVKETRGKTNTVSIEHFDFYCGNERVRDLNINIWNPYNGERDIYRGKWNDSDTKTLVFRFTHPVAITRYDIKTSHTFPSNDPRRWTLEGSKNASYWVLLDKRDMSLPVRRAYTNSFYLDEDYDEQ